jgi:hypothetical protein
MGLELKELLRGKSQYASLEELKVSGRQRVRVINPESIATLIREQMPKLAEENGWVAKDRVDELVEKGRAELRHLLHTREAEVAAAREQLAELEDLRVREREHVQEAERLRDALRRAKEGQSSRESGRESTRQPARESSRESSRESGREPAREYVREPLRDSGREPREKAPPNQPIHVTVKKAEPPEDAEPAPAAAGPTATVNAQVLERLVSEFSNLRKTLQNANEAAANASKNGDPALAEKLEKLAENLGRKLDHMSVRGGGGGGSSGNEPEIKFDGLFAHETDKTLETNMDDVGVKNREGKGIGGNLERIRKLRGGS